MFSVSKDMIICMYTTRRKYICHITQSTGLSYNVFRRLARLYDGLALGEFLLDEELRALHRLEKRHLPVHVLGVAVFLLVELHQIDVRKLCTGLNVLREGIPESSGEHCDSKRHREGEVRTSSCRPACFPPATN